MTINGQAFLEKQKECIKKAQNRVRKELSRHPEKVAECRAELERLKQLKKGINKELDKYKDFSTQEAVRLFGKRFQDLTADEKKEYCKAIVYKHRAMKKEQKQ
jgi:hypothetical protein